MAICPARNQADFTEFGLFIKDNCDPSLVVTNLDYVVWSKDSQSWCLIEEKRGKSGLTSGPRRTFRMLDEACWIYAAAIDRQYNGFFLLQFESSGPEDGRIWLNGDHEISQRVLASFIDDAGKGFDPFWSRKDQMKQIKKALKIAA